MGGTSWGRRAKPTRFHFPFPILSIYMRLSRLPYTGSTGQVRRDMSLAQLPFLPPAEQQVILEGPALPPPPGRVSMFENPPNNNGLALAVAILGLSVSSILLLFRACTKIVVLRAVRIEDGM